MKKKLQAFAAAALTLCAAAALAHGNEGHAATRTYDAAKVQDTPFGREGNPAKATRTIRVDMTDAMRFTPTSIAVKRGETVKLVATNKGQVLHEMVLGTADELRKHAELMKKFPGMEHDEPHMVHVKPGKSGEIVWQFTQAGEFQFACLIPGHFEAGMVGKVTVGGDDAAAPQSDGEVRKVDKAQGKLTLRHGPLKQFDMPAMTMVFRVADPKMLDGLKDGDKVRFTAEKVNGAFTVMAIQPAR